MCFVCPSFERLAPESLQWCTIETGNFYIFSVSDGDHNLSQEMDAGENELSFLSIHSGLLLLPSSGGAVRERVYF